MKNRFYWGSFVLLTIFLTFTWHHSLQANQPPLPNDGEQPTILGDPVSGTTVSSPTPPATPAEIERPSGNELVYLPLIFSHLLSPEAQAVVDLINAHRISAGCSPLQVNAKLVNAAQAHTEDMVFNDFFSHTGSNGSNPGQRIAAQGYSYSTWGENIAAGYSTATSAVNGWMNSKGHRNNILNCNFKETGVGYYFLANDPGDENWRYYWTQVFASP